MSLYRQLEIGKLGGEVSNGGVQDLLTSIATNPEALDEPETRELVAWEIGHTMCGFLLKWEEDLDINMSLASMGIDSLVSIKIRTWWRRTFGVDISVLEVMNAKTVEGLGRMAIASLRERHAADI